MKREKSDFLALSLIGAFLVIGFAILILPPKRTMEATLAWVRQEFPAVPRLQPAELAAWLHDTNRPQPELLDIRTPEEFATSHLSGAVQVSPNIRVKDLIRRFGTDKPLVLYCSVGYRSSQLADALIGSGRKNVFNLEGSIFAWANAAFPLERDGRLVREVHPYSRSYLQLLRPEHRPSLSFAWGILNDLSPLLRVKLGSAALLMVALLLWESTAPFFSWFHRRFSERVAHGWRNSILGMINMLLGALLFVRLWLWAAAWSRSHHFGLLYWVELEGITRICLAVLLLDFWSYWWHRLNHSLAWLWRFHRVHHSDTRLDVTSANRFHFGELLFSSLLRVPLILLTGLTFSELLIYETGLFAVVQFHHANIHLPPPFERGLSRLIVTPDFHRVHHSKYAPETDSNFASLLSIWDRLFGTRKFRSDPGKIEFGLEDEAARDSNGIVPLLESPFEPLSSHASRAATLQQS